MKVFVIIPAAGLGTRMAAGKRTTQGTPSKQFTEVGGVPILIHTLRKFAGHPAIGEISVALRKQEGERFKPRLTKEGFKLPVRIVEGGDNRQQSVANALAAISGDAQDIVLVHDAVRPFVDSEIIMAVIEAAQKHGAAIAGIPASDTIKQVDRTAEGALITATIPRERLVMAQTPQGFCLGILKKAFDEATRDAFTGTDEASLVERSGHDVAVVMGSQRNIKITTPADLQLAEFYLEQEAHDRESLAG
jgi:2-C-methyl-D-erythritol 4-phosphate cytidylyltransferase